MLYWIQAVSLLSKDCLWNISRRKGWCVIGLPFTLRGCILFLLFFRLLANKTLTMHYFGRMREIPKLHLFKAWAIGIVFKAWTSGFFKQCRRMRSSMMNSFGRLCRFFCFVALYVHFLRTKGSFIWSPRRKLFPAMWIGFFTSGTVLLSILNLPYLHQAAHMGWDGWKWGREGPNVGGIGERMFGSVQEEGGRG